MDGAPGEELVEGLVALQVRVEELVGLDRIGLDEGGDRLDGCGIVVDLALLKQR